MVRLFAASLALLVSSAVWADFDKGMIAYRAGDFEQAFEEFHAAAVAGDATAQFNVGVMYFRGEFVQRDPVKAYGWIDLAASQPDTDFLTQAHQILAVILTRDEVTEGRTIAAELAKKHGLTYQPTIEDLEGIRVVTR